MKRFLTTPLIVLAAICAAGVALGHTGLHRSSAHHVEHRYKGPQLVIPALGVHATIVGIGADGTVGNAALRIPSNVHRVGWWNGKVFNGARRTRVPAPRPGEPGVALFAGHVDSAQRGPGALYYLRYLKRGDVIRVVGLHHHTTTWRVIAAPTLSPKTALPSALFNIEGPARLAIVTCGGAFDLADGHYLDNVIVWAAPVRHAKPVSRSTAPRRDGVPVRAR